MKTEQQYADELIEKHYLVNYIIPPDNGVNPYMSRFYAKEHAKIDAQNTIDAQPFVPNNSKPFGVKIQSVRQNCEDADNYYTKVLTILNDMK